MDVYGAPYQISVSLVCSGKQPCRVPPWLAGIHLRDFTLTALKAAVAVTLHASGVLALFSPMGEWANWQIGGIGICRWCQCWSNELNTLERCAVMRSEVAFPQVATPPCFWFLFSVSCRFELPLVGGEPVCYIHLILHDMEEVCRHAIFVRFKLHGAWLPSFRLVPCCFWEAVTHAYGISRLVFPFFIILLVSSVRHFLLRSNNCIIGCEHKVSEWALHSLL